MKEYAEREAINEKIRKELEREEKEELEKQVRQDVIV